MVVFSFICSILFCVVMLTFIVGMIISFRKSKKQVEDMTNLINGFEIFDTKVGANDKEKE